MLVGAVEESVVAALPAVHMMHSSVNIVAIFVVFCFIYSPHMLFFLF